LADKDLVILHNIKISLPKNKEQHMGASNQVCS